MQRARRAAWAAIGAVVVLTLAAAPAAAAPSSTSEELIRGLNRRLLYIAVPIALLVEFILVYTVWRFRGDHEPEPTRTNRDLEITWTLATALVLLFVGSASYAVLTSPHVAAVPELNEASLGGDADGGSEAPQPSDAPEDAVVVEIVAEQWEYTFRYSGENVTADEELVLPRDRPVYLYATSEDVIHSVHVPQLGLKQDAFPDQYHLVRTRLTERGEYRLYCAELCGAGHAGMQSTVRVVDDDEYERWLDDRREGVPGGAQQNGTTEASSQRLATNAAGEPARATARAAD